jgi:hypothetical protein
MSVRSLAVLAVARDRAAAGQPAGAGGSTPAVRDPAGLDPEGVPATEPPASGGVPQSFSDVLITAIPTEPLAAYTALVGVTVGALSLDRPADYLPFRWAIFVVFLLITGVSVLTGYRRGAETALRRVPVAEMLAAVVAGAAWGLVMPGSPLNAQISGTARTLTIAAITIGAAAVLTLLSAPQLKTGATTRTHRQEQQPAG